MPFDVLPYDCELLPKYCACPPKINDSTPLLPLYSNTPTYYRNVSFCSLANITD